MPSRGSRVTPAAVLLACALLLARAAASQTAEPPVEPPAEPPADAPEGVDYETVTADSIEVGVAETGFGATGRAGEAPHTRRRVRFSDGGFAGEAREGAGDPLAGGMIETRSTRGRWSAGRLRPVWACGLALGGAAEPWRMPAGDRPARAPVGAAGGDGVRWQSGSGAPVCGFVLDVLCGHFGGRDVAGARLGRSGVRLGALAARAGSGAAVPGPVQTSVSVEVPDLEAELAMDRAGRWRAETALRRDLGGARLSARARGGLEGFRALVEPRRTAPARALSVRLDRAFAHVRAGVAGALWRFRPGLAGGRGALEVATRLAHHDQLVVGFEEQHGARREPAADPGRFRQGAWGEWRGGSERLRLVLREESWGERAWVRGAVRSVSAAGVEVIGPAGSVFRLSHCAYRVRRGESLYLPEAETDRLVLRALSGVGERTRIELQCPLAGGLARATAAWTAAAAGPPRVQWRLEWNRRASIRRST